MVALLAALATIRVEPFLDIRWGILVALTLIADDGRWIGGTLGAWLPGGVRPSRAIGIGLLTVPAGPSMVALSAVGLQAGLLTPPVGLGLVAAVLVIELTGPIRRKLSADLDPDRPGRESGP
jgi:Kef-type K+ transport system membrane component KefB